MKSLTPLIERILREHPKTRDSDKELFIGVLQAQGFRFTERDLQIFKSVNLESVRRTRQKLQEQGKYLPSPEVAKQRKLKSMIMQQNSPTAKPERIEHLVEHQPKIQRAVSWLKGD